MKINKTAVLTSIGAGLEYYDFIVYAFLAQYISRAFFPSSDYLVSLIASFGVFAIGYFVRPIGGIIFGAFGDRFGRKKVFLFSIILMAVATFLMGILPTYQSWGITATFLIMFLRILQGISFGAELPGATTFITEHSEKSMRGLNCALMICFVTVGVLTASFVVYIMTQLLGTVNMQNWGWRVPFILGGFLALAAYFIRNRTKESPYFENNKNKLQNPFWTLITKYPHKLIIVGGFILFPSTLVMFALCMPTYFSLTYGYKAADVYLGISIGYGWSITTLIIFGIFSDKFKRKKVFLTVSLIFIVVCVFYFKMLHGASFSNLILFIMIYQTFISLYTVCYYPIISENFPTEVRYSGVAICYNVVYAFTSLVPMLVNYMYEKTQSEYPAIILLAGFALISIICLFFIKDYTGKEMQQ
jgi:MFS family permease